MNYRRRGIVHRAPGLHAVDDRDLPGYTVDTEAVTPVRRQTDVEHPVIQAHRLC